MKKNKRSKPSLLRPMIIGGSLVVVLVVMFYSLRPKTLVAPTTTADTSAVTITTDDGIALAATVKYPVRNVQVPAVILLHDYAKDRHQWDTYLQKFLEAGIAVVSYDMRGFGESRLSAIPLDQQAHLAMLPDDLPAVMAYLKQQPSIDPDRISVVGVGVGADVVYVASGSNLGLYRSVIVSPATIGSALDGHTFPGFAPLGVAGLAETAKADPLNRLMSVIQEPKQSQTISTPATGIDLLENPEVLPAIVTWITS